MPALVFTGKTLSLTHTVITTLTITTTTLRGDITIRITVTTHIITSIITVTITIHITTRLITTITTHTKHIKDMIAMVKELLTIPAQKGIAMLIAQK